MVAVAAVPGVAAATKGRRASASASDATSVWIRPDLMSPKSRPGNTSSVLVPREEMLASTRWRDPSPRATTDTTDAMPMMMPSMVRKLRSLCARMDTTAMRKASKKAEPGRADAPLAAAWRRTAAAVSGWLRRSAMMRPSLISMTRRARAATLGSWVTMMIVRPSAFSSDRMDSTSSPLRLSRAPVGSSARMTLASFISARAMDTRCCWPPDRAAGRWSSRAPMPSLSRSDAARARRADAASPR